MNDLLNMTLADMTALLEAWGEKPYRAKQLFAFVHRGMSFDAMMSLPKALRERLAAEYCVNGVSIQQQHISKLDGTVKLLYRLRDGHLIEGVLMHYKHGNTLCLSTQVGCKMGCAFCASTLDGCARNLSAGEMLGQIHAARELSPIHNVVLMGSGEPLDNYDETVRFLRLLRDPEGLCIGMRHVSLSTCGLTPQIQRFAKEGLPVTLSISLHAPEDEIRRRLMPVAKVYPMAPLLEACREYIEQTGRRVIFEYALIRDINSRPEHARALAQRLRGMQCHVNVIPLNAVAEAPLQGVDEATVQAFLQTLAQCHISATRRREMGDDIQGACGQLRRHQTLMNSEEGI